MEDVLGGRTSPESFSLFLEDWERILARRVEQAITAFSAVEGINGLVLAGSVGRGEHWPLSDIDFLTIYEDGPVHAAEREITRQRDRLLARWIDEGWWTGLDIGRLSFTCSEIALPHSLETGITVRLQDDRWYYSLDKGYRGRAVFDPDGLASKLANWCSDNRFSEPTVRFRMARARSEIDTARLRSIEAAELGDVLTSITAIRAAANWAMAWQFEQWEERDASLGRIGTRFERLARSRGRYDLVDALRELLGLEADLLRQRMAAAPDWVRERHERSFRARRHIGEEVTRADDARDTLRVCFLFETRRIPRPPFSAWLGVPTDTGALWRVVQNASILLDHWVSGNEIPTSTC